MKLQELLEGTRSYAVYFDATGAGQGPKPVAGPFKTEREAQQWLKDEEYDGDNNYFVDKHHEENEEIWDKPTPKGKETGKLSSEQKAKAKARAKREGRPYPNRIDNMWAAQLGESATLQSLLKSKIVGNAMSDRRLMDDLHDFIADDSNSMLERRKALQKLDAVMGEEGGLPSAQEVQEYLDDH
jgi:hypothetical protein